MHQNTDTIPSILHLTTFFELFLVTLTASIQFNEFITWHWDWVFVHLQVLGDYTRQNKSKDQVDKFIDQIKSIASNKTDDHFFNVEDERALITIVDALGSKIFALEGNGDVIL